MFLREKMYYVHRFAIFVLESKASLQNWSFLSALFKI